MPGIETAITLPFSIDSTGNVANTYDQTKIWADRVRSVVGTLKTERIMDATFGTRIPTTVFEDFSSVQESVSREIADSFATFLPQLTLDGVVVVTDEETNSIVADITYSLPNKKTSIISVGIASLSGNNIINEVSL